MLFMYGHIRFAHKANCRYVAGGVQLHNFRSLGRQTHARADALLLQHGTEVHVTVVAENAAGLTTAIYSDPRTVDLTPPQLCCLIVSDYQQFIEWNTSKLIDSTCMFAKT